MQAPHDLAADVHHRGVSDLHRRGQVRRALQLARVRSGESQGGGTGVTQRMGVRLEDGLNDFLSYVSDSVYEIIEEVPHMLEQG